MSFLTRYSPTLNFILRHSIGMKFRLLYHSFTLVVLHSPYTSIVHFSTDYFHRSISLSFPFSTYSFWYTKSSADNPKRLLCILIFFRACSFRQLARVKCVFTSLLRVRRGGDSDDSGDDDGNWPEKKVQVFTATKLDHFAADFFISFKSFWLI